MGECADAVCLWEALSSSEPWISGWKKPHVFFSGDRSICPPPLGLHPSLFDWLPDCSGCSMIPLIVDQEHLGDVIY